MNYSCLETDFREDLLDKDWLFFCPHVDAKTWHRGFCLYFSDLQSYKCPIERGFKISAWMRQSSATSNTLWACVIFFGQITVQRYFVFISTVGLLTLYIQELPYNYEHILWIGILKKSGRTHAHFQYNARKLMSLKSVLPWGILREN